MTNIKNTDTIVVTGGVGRLKNEKPKYDYQFPPDGPSDSLLASADYDYDRRLEKWNKDEQAAIANQFSTDAADGEYLFSDFGEEQILKKSTSAIAGKIKCVKFRSLTQPKPVEQPSNTDNKSNPFKQINFNCNLVDYLCQVAEISGMDIHEQSTLYYIMNMWDKKKFYESSEFIKMEHSHSTTLNKKPVEQPEVKGETVEEAFEGMLISQFHISRKMLIENPQMLTFEHLLEMFTFATNQSDQRHAAEREVLVKRVAELESALGQIKKFAPGTKVYKLATEAINQKD